jgi:zinc protease
VGDFNKNKIVDWCSNLINQIKSNDLNFKIKKDLKQNKARFGSKIKQCAQSHIALAYKTCSINSKDACVLKLLYSVLAGQSGRLFVNLRDKKSLAYTVCPIMMFGIEKGYFGAYIACEHNKKQEAIDSIKTEFKNLKEKIIDDIELKRAKNYLLGSYVLGMQKYSELAFNYAFDELYKLGFDYYKKHETIIDNISSEDIIKISNKYFQDKQENLLIISN